MYGNFVFLLALVSLSSICTAAPEIHKQHKTDETSSKEPHKIQARNGKAYHPCPHHNGQDNAYSLIQGQSEGRIVNKPNYHNSNHALETAASNSLAQTVTLNSQIAVGGSSGGGYSSSTPINHQHLPSVGRPPAFNNNYLPPQSPPQLPPAPAPLPVPPPPPPSSQFNANFHRPNHYETQQGSQGGYQYASAFTSNRFTGAQSSYHQQQNNNFNYRPSQQLSNGNAGHFGTNGHFGSNGAYAGSFSHQTHGQHSHGVHPIPSVSHNSLDGHLGHIIQDTFAHASLDPTAEKHIYVHVPPEDLEEKSQQQHAHIVQPPAQKHYKIIFIKAPTYNQPNAAQLAAAAAAQQSEEKTLIYVLVKKPEEPSIDELQQIQESAVKHHKPEVYFIKYKTRKEGEDLQNQLLQQGTLPGVPELGEGDIDIRLGSGPGASLSSVSTSNSYATSAISTPSSHQPDEFYGVPIQ